MRDSFHLFAGAAALILAVSASTSYGDDSESKSKSGPAGEAVAEKAKAAAKSKDAPKSNDAPKAKAATEEARPKAKAPEKATKPAVKPKEEKPAPKQAEAKPEAKEEKEKTHRVVEGPIVVKTKLSGIVEAVENEPVAMDLKRWSDMTVISAVPHGTEVKKGDVLIELDTERLEKQIRESRLAMPLKELELAALELELEKLEKSTPLTLESSRRSKMQAEEDLAYFEDVTRPMREKDAKESVRSRGEYLAYAMEELNQLKKMYEADDLTEETEEIILRRAENTVREYEWLLEQTKERTDRTLSTTLPREHENMQRSLELREISWRAGEKSTRDALEKKRLEVKAKVREMEETVKQLEEFQQDLKALAVRAPRSGIVYYGMTQRGKWTTGATIEKKLIPGGKLTMREIVMTIVDPSKLQLRIGVAEDKLKGLSVGQDATITLKWDGDAKRPGKLQHVSHVPFSDGTFDAVVSIGGGEKDANAFPGMKADVEITTYENKKALTVPKAAIKKDGDKEQVTLAGGKVVAIETGRTSGDKVEVTKGLKAGDEVQLPDPPKKQADAGEAKTETEKKAG